MYGIVKQNSGFIDLEGKPGKGSTFTIFLPRHVGKASPEPVEPSEQPTPGGRSSILLVEDEPAMDEGVAFIQKPFSVEEMVSKVRQVLDSTHT